jgi:hypothetical protein
MVKIRTFCNMSVKRFATWTSKLGEETTNSPLEERGSRTHTRGGKGREAYSREQRAESREQRAEDRGHYRFVKLT